MISFLDLLFPKRCLGCRKWGRYICPMCEKTIKPLRYLKCPVCEKPAIEGMTHPGCQTKYSLDGLTSFFRYDGVIKEAIKHIKYRYTFDITRELINSIPLSSFSIFSKLLNIYTSKYFSCSFVPIPLHPSRYRHRGFNQAEVIAHSFGKRLEIPVDTNILIRTKKTIPQVEMKDREKRLANMKDVFSFNNSQLVTRNSRIFLVDDVFTTGATLRSAASVLKHEGAKFVWGITIAQ